MRHRSRSVVAAAAVCTAAGAASAIPTPILISFPSDSDGSNFTFRGTAGSGGAFGITQDGSPHTAVQLFLDDFFAGQPPVVFDVGFTTDIRLSWASSELVGASYQHTYLASGQFSFVDRASGAELIRGFFDAPGQPAVFTVRGGEFSWGSSGTLLGSDVLYSGNGVRYQIFQGLMDAGTAQGIDLSAYGVRPGDSGIGLGPEDLGFTFTFLSGLGGGLVQLDPGTHLPAGAFVSEGSFSGTMYSIPAPGAGAALAGVGLAAVRRRRR